MRCFRLRLASSLVGFFAAGSAWAANPGPLETPLPDPESIYGGMPVAACAWPQTIDLEGACSGTLVHPQVVVYAQHCGSNYSKVWMGENINQPRRTLKPEFCKTKPGGGPGTGQDFAFCKLSEPVLDVPLVPILMGCETEILKPGQEVTIVGFGDADNNQPYGVKRSVTTTITGFQGQEINIGGGGKDSCQGDSGGPVFVQLANGDWRVFGITSYGGACGTGGVYSMMHNGVAWIEEETGIDITPCHDADGTWHPGFGCKGFPVDPVTGGGNWNMGCSGGAVSDFSASCGAPFDPKPDMDPPVVTILQPTDGMEFMGDGGAAVTVTVDAQDGDGWGVKEVRLTINGKDFNGNIDSFMPYEYPLMFPSGGFCIGAFATDLADNVGEATPVCIGINGPPPPPPEPETTTGGDSETEGLGTTGGDADSATGTGGAPTEGGGSESSGGSNDSEGNLDSSDSASASATAGATGGDKDDSGCGCRSGHAPKDSLLALAGLGLLGLARRRRG